MSFEALRGDLESLQKAMPQGAEAGSADGASGAADKTANAAGQSDSEGGELLGKSFSMRLEDGSEMEVVDGTELVKSFGVRLGQGEEAFAKAMGEIEQVMSAQNALIKSLHDQVATLRGTGSGRRSVLTMSEKVTATNTTQPLAKSFTPASVVDAAERAYQKGDLSSTRLAEVETLLGKSMALPPDLARIVASHMD